MSGSPPPTQASRGAAITRSRAVRAALALGLLSATGCGGDTGTIRFDLVFPPGTDALPAGAARVRLTLDEPFVVAEGPIGADGSFDLALSTPAIGGAARLSFEALDVAGSVLARGRTPPLPLGAVDDRLAIFVAPPGRFAEAPVALPEPLDEIAVAPLALGVLLAGGRGGSGARSAALAVYSVYTHELQAGAPLPAARAGLTAAAGSLGMVYLFGGAGTGDAPTADLWRFDTNAPPAGTYTALASAPELARTGAAAARLASDLYLVSGAPAALLDGTGGRIVAFANAPADAAETATATQDDGAPVAVLAGPAGILVYDALADEFRLASELPAPAGHAAAALPGGDVLLVGGADSGGPVATALRVSPGGAVTTVALLARARAHPTSAAVGGVLVVAGGFDASGAALPDAELFDASTLAPAGTAPLVAARGGAVVAVLPNDSLLLVGGRAAAGGPPAGPLEVFTP